MATSKAYPITAKQQIVVDGLLETLAARIHDFLTDEFPEGKIEASHRSDEEFSSNKIARHTRELSLYLGWNTGLDVRLDWFNQPDMKTNIYLSIEGASRLLAKLVVVLLVTFSFVGAGLGLLAAEGSSIGWAIGAGVGCVACLPAIALLHLVFLPVLSKKKNQALSESVQASLDPIVEEEISRSADRLRHPKG